MTYHVFTTAPGKDRAAAARLERFGIRAVVLMEEHKVRRGRSGVRVRVERPLMPGYVFGCPSQPLCASLAARLMFLDREPAKRPACPITGLLRRISGAPAVLTESEVRMIEGRATALAAKRSTPVRFSHGQTVRAASGPLMGFHAIIADVLGEEYEIDVMTDRGPWRVRTDGRNFLAA